MRFKVLIVLSFLSFAASFPAKLLRVPKIYNALITTKEKLLPSEAYPATTGPIFQPVSFSSEPILLNANEFLNNGNQQVKWGRNSQNDAESNKESKASNTASAGKELSPLVFYPRYGLYYPHHTFISYVNTLQHSFIYSSIDHSKSPVKNSPVETQADGIENADDYLDVASSYPQSEVSFLKNKRPNKVFDVPLPPPAVGYLNLDRENDKVVS